MLLPYNWKLWDGSRHGFTRVDRGYEQDPVEISIVPESVKPVSTKYATAVLKATGGLSPHYMHKNNLGLAPFAFAWSESPEPPPLGESFFKGHRFASADWYLAGEVVDGQSCTSDKLDVDEAVRHILGSVDLLATGPGTTAREQAIKEYVGSKRLELGKTYYFHVFRCGGNALFTTAGFHTGDAKASGELTEPVNFVRSAIVTSAPITMPSSATTFVVSFNTNGGSSIRSYLITLDQTCPKPPDPTKDGFTFAGWYCDADFQVPFNFHTPITREYSLYSQWKSQGPEKYIVEFSTYEGSYVTPQLVARGEKATVPTKPTKQGYAFRQWCSDPEGLIPFDFDAGIHRPTRIYAWWDLLLEADG